MLGFVLTTLYPFSSPYIHILTLSGETLEAVTIDQFAHVSLGLCSEPSSGVLRRHLMALLIDKKRGELPHSSDSLYRLVQWVVEIWLLYNSLMLQMDLPELTAGKVCVSIYALFWFHLWIICVSDFI